jgi:GTP pyrophosphokinase
VHTYRLIRKNKCNNIVTRHRIAAVGFVNRFTDVISNQLGLNIRTIQLESSGGLVEAEVTIYVHNTQNLKDLIAKLKEMKEIRKVVRLERLNP